MEVNDMLVELWHVLVRTYTPIILTAVVGFLKSAARGRRRLWSAFVTLALLAGLMICAELQYGAWTGYGPPVTFPIPPIGSSAVSENIQVRLEAQSPLNAYYGMLKRSSFVLDVLGESLTIDPRRVRALEFKRHVSQGRDLWAVVDEPRDGSETDRVFLGWASPGGVPVLDLLGQPLPLNFNDVLVTSAVHLNGIEVQGGTVYLLLYDGRLLKCTKETSWVQPGQTVDPPKLTLVGDLNSIYDGANDGVGWQSLDRVDNLASLCKLLGVPERPVSPADEVFLAVNARAGEGFVFRLTVASSFTQSEALLQLSLVDSWSEKERWDEGAAFQAKGEPALCFTDAYHGTYYAMQQNKTTWSGKVETRTAGRSAAKASGPKDTPPTVPYLEGCALNGSDVFFSDREGTVFIVWNYAKGNHRAATIGPVPIVHGQELAWDPDLKNPGLWIAGEHAFRFIPQSMLRRRYVWLHGVIQNRDAVWWALALGFVGLVALAARNSTASDLARGAGRH